MRLEEQKRSLDCYHSGQNVACADLAAAPQRWPQFATAAHEQGFAAVQADPMPLLEQILGALNLFCCSPRAIPAAVTEVAQSFASRVVIEQAKGVLAERQHINPTEAFALMRTYARNHNRLLSQVALSASPRLALSHTWVVARDAGPPRVPD